jgi:hypothetical protein
MLTAQLLMAQLSMTATVAVTLVLIVGGDDAGARVFSKRIGIHRGSAACQHRKEYP